MQNTPEDVKEMDVAKEARLRKLVEAMQIKVNRDMQGRKVDDIAVFNSYPNAISSTLAKDIGVIINVNFDVSKLVGDGSIAPPNKLLWAHCANLKSFSEFLSNTGTPAYVCFGNIPEVVACAKILAEHCTKQNTQLPIWECCVAVISKRQQIELILLDI